MTMKNFKFLKTKKILILLSFITFYSCGPSACDCLEITKVDSETAWFLKEGENPYKAADCYQEFTDGPKVFLSDKVKYDARQKMYEDCK